MKIIVFGHDASNANLERRITAMQSLGHEVMALTMRRDDDKPRAWNNIDLGQTFDEQYGQRLMAICKGCSIAKQYKDEITKADLIWARNLDMLVVAAHVRRSIKSPPPLVYETIDIHQSLYRRSVSATALRFMESRLLHKVKLIVVSSPAFVSKYYDQYHPQHPPTGLIENVLNTDDLPPRPTYPAKSDAPLTIGWVGILRCAKSLKILSSLAHKAGGAIRIALHGKPALATVPAFHQVVDAHPFMHYHGPYRAPHGLEKVYQDIDLIWAGDYYQADGNSRWLLPNRIYEGGYFGVPALAPEGTQTAKWLQEKGTGLAVQEPVQDHLYPLIKNLTADKTLSILSKTVRNTDSTVFARGPDDLDRCLKRALAPEPAPEALS